MTKKRQTVGIRHAIKQKIDALKTRKYFELDQIARASVADSMSALGQKQTLSRV